MDRMSHAEQHRPYPEGTVVITADGERLGTIRTVYPHFLLVAQDGAPHADLEVPLHALARYEGAQLYLTVNREALSIVDDNESADRRLHLDNT